jgi:XTP/dITP diphosphohydrolase
VIADDSGLEVDALDGAPGVRSARYAGPDADGHRNVEKLLAALAFVAPQPEKRTARFVCAIVAARDGILLGTFEGRLEGVITATPRGSGGFGYDCVFQPLGRDGTLAELPPDEKNRLSHRAVAAAHFTQALARNDWT